MEFDGIINLVCYGGIVFTIVMFFKDDKKTNKWGNVASTIGVLGTFGGIALGLIEFDPYNISESVPKLLVGMRTAFSTSIAGMITSLFMKITQNFLIRKDDENIDNIEDLFNDMIKESRNTNKTLIRNQQEMIEQFNKQEDNWRESQEALKKEICNLNNSLTTKQDELIQEFKVFGKEMAKNNTDALIDALNGVIRDFNDKITEQFGENFKELNKAVGSLLVWQENYKEIIENTENNLKSIFDSISIVEQDIKSVSESSIIIKDNNEKLMMILDSVERQQNSIEDGLESLEKTAKNAIELIPNLDIYFNSSKEHIIKSIDSFQECLEENTNKLNKHMDIVVSDTSQTAAVIFDKTKEYIENNNELFKNDASRYVDTFTTLVDNFNNTIPCLRKSIEEANTRFNNDLIEFTSEIKNVIKLQLSSMQGQCETIENTTNNINNQVDTIIVESNKRLEEITINTSQQIKTIVDEVEKVFTDKVDQLDKLLETELTNSLNSLGRQLVTISERFTDDYGLLADKLSDVTKLAEGVY